MILASNFAPLMRGIMVLMLLPVILGIPVMCFVKWVPWIGLVVGGICSVLGLLFLFFLGLGPPGIPLRFWACGSLPLVFGVGCLLLWQYFAQRD